MAETEIMTKAQHWRRRIQGWFWQLLAVLVLLLVLEAFLTRESMGLTAPMIEATTLEGTAFSLQQLRGSPAVVHFWASWCPVCELEQGMVQGLAAELPVITVAMSSGSAQQVRDYLQRQGVSYPVINDERGWHAARYGVKAVPASFVLDGEGTVRFATRGYTSGWGMRIRLWLAGLF